MKGLGKKNPPPKKKTEKPNALELDLELALKRRSDSLDLGVETAARFIDGREPGHQSAWLRTMGSGHTPHRRQHPVAPKEHSQGANIDMRDA